MSNQGIKLYDLLRLDLLVSCDFPPFDDVYPSISFAHGKRDVGSKGG
jgi:hypothetical protein